MWAHALSYMAMSSAGVLWQRGIDALDTGQLRDNLRLRWLNFGPNCAWPLPRDVLPVASTFSCDAEAHGTPSTFLHLCFAVVLVLCAYRCLMWLQTRRNGKSRLLFDLEAATQTLSLYAEKVLETSDLSVDSLDHPIEFARSVSFSLSPEQFQRSSISHNHSPAYPCAGLPISCVPPAPVSEQLEVAGALLDLQSSLEADVEVSRPIESEILDEATRSPIQQSTNLQDEPIPCYVPPMLSSSEQTSKLDVETGSDSVDFDDFHRTESGLDHAPEQATSFHEPPHSRHLSWELDDDLNAILMAVFGDTIQRCEERARLNTELYLLASNDPMVVYNTIQAELYRQWKGLPAAEVPKASRNRMEMTYARLAQRLERYRQVRQTRGPPKHSQA